MPVLETFGVDELVTSGREVRKAAADSSSMEQAAQRIVGYLSTSFVDGQGRSACVLVRLYKTHRYADLPPDLQTFALEAGGPHVTTTTRCLTLLATRGVEPRWNDRLCSESHQAIPLTSPDAIRQSPMISALLDQMGIGVAAVVDPDPAMSVQRHHERYNIFFVPDARQSAAVPAQAGFVEPYGVRSVLGFGGALPTGDVFAAILFSRVTLSPSVANLFSTFAVAVKAALIPYSLNVF